MNLSDRDINRFIEAQDRCYPYSTNNQSIYLEALQEIQNGKKTSHWIWFIFPQLRGLGHSSYAIYFGITNKYEAEEYLSNNVLRSRLRQITKALLSHKDKTALAILGHIDAIKVRSCMTLFDYLSPNDIFEQALHQFYNGTKCDKTLSLLSQ